MILNSEISGIFRATTTDQMVKEMAAQDSGHQLGLVCHLKGCLTVVMTYRTWRIYLRGTACVSRDVIVLYPGCNRMWLTN